MAVAQDEMWSFITKFRQLQGEGYYANLNFSCAHGKVYVAFHADLGNPNFFSTGHRCFNRIKPTQVCRLKRREEYRKVNQNKASNTVTATDTFHNNLSEDTVQGTLPDDVCMARNYESKISSQPTLPPDSSASAECLVNVSAIPKVEEALYECSIDVDLIKFDDVEESIDCLDNTQDSGEASSLAGSNVESEKVSRKSQIETDYLEDLVSMQGTLHNLQTIYPFQASNFC